MGNCCSCCESQNNLPDKKPSQNVGGRDQVDAPAPQTPLKVTKLDLKLIDNGDEHRTRKYELMMRTPYPNLIVRRGQPFLVDVTFDRKFFKDRVSFTFTVADTTPSPSNGTMIVVPLLPKNSDLSGSEGHDWLAQIDHTDDDKTVTVQLRASSKCTVGKWNLAVDSKLELTGQTLSYNHPHPIYILFNPWCSGDQVYMPEEDARVEYVLEDTGLIWRGSHNRLRPCPWAYSQFEKDILDCALYLLEKNVNPVGRASSVKTCRALSALVNSADDQGLLEGNWSDDFSAGVAPTEWTGSAKIIQNYFTKKKPVKFGQCWVFAGVLTSVCRALGIPSRPVTNFSSAHDTQSSMTIDYFVDSEGKPVKSLNTDSIWNFHVWNEVYMTRDDLEDKIYDGWQAIDATPQERSLGIYQLGPASVEACRRGRIKVPFDVPFLYSEVNADKVYWRYFGPSQPLKLLSNKPDSESIGISISTKAIGAFEREDITQNYKYAEKSSEEREAMWRALKLSESSFSRFYINEKFSHVKFDLSLIDDVIIGASFRVVLTIENQSPKDEYKVSGSLQVDTVLNTGEVKELVIKRPINISIPSKTRKETTLLVTYDNYNKLMTPEGAFNISCLAKVHETDFEYFAQDDFRVRRPDIKFQMPNVKEICVGQSFEGKVSMKNPLPVKLSKCFFKIDAPGCGQPIEIKLKTSVGVGEMATTSFKLTPRVPGDKAVTAKFSSRELLDVDGFVTLQVKTATVELPSNFL